jgi:hypothetical protein
MKRTAYFGLRMAFFILFLANTGHLFAQDETEKETKEEHYGLKIGVNFAELWGEDALPESDRKIGYSFGLYGSYKISQEWKIQPETIWSLQGENSKESGRYKISYINIPIMFKWTKKNFYVELGPQFGFLTINTSKSVPDSLKLENFETFDFSFNTGIGYVFLDDWSFGLRYTEGITNLVRGRDLRNSVIYLGISYRLF